MSTRTNWFVLFLIPFLGMLLTGGHVAQGAGVTLYTPYTKISVPPGESIDYTIEVINNSSGIRDIEFSLLGLPKDWEYTLKSGGWNIEQLSVLPGEKKNVSLQVEVPLKVDKGTYLFKVAAKGFDVLPLTVTVSEHGTFKTEFTAKQANMEGHANSSFSFNAELKNRTGEKQLYSLRAQAPRGWSVIFKPNYKQATSVNVDVNATENISIDVNPPGQIAAGTYKIPVEAVTRTTSANLELEVVITGSYELELTTPTGLLSSSIVAGDEERIELVVKNTGSSELKDIEFTSSSPSQWDVIFEPQKIDRLEPGKSARTFATIQAYDKAIPGDYVAHLEAKTPEASSKASFRVSVKTSVMSGWIGGLIILIAFGSIYQLFRKYGRR